MSAPADIDDMTMLAEFAQFAMARARAASARAEAVEAQGGDPTQHLVAFDRMGRAMRLALALRRRFANEAQAQAAERVQVRKEKLKAALAPAIRLHAHTVERQRLDWALAERLETEADAFADLPLDVGIAALKEALGLPQFVQPEAEIAARAQDHPPSQPSSTVPITGLSGLLTPEILARAHLVAGEVPHSATGPP